MIFMAKYVNRKRYSCQIKVKVLCCVDIISIPFRGETNWSNSSPRNMRNLKKMTVFIAFQVPSLAAICVFAPSDSS